MKKTIKVTVTLKDKTVEYQGEQQQRNLQHFNTQLNTHSTTIKPKKGKGSYKRNKKIEKSDLNER